MDAKKKVLSVAGHVIHDFHPDADVQQSFENLGLDSLDRFGLIADVEHECNVSMPAKLVDKINSVGDIVVAVENLKRVKKTRDTWVPCTFNCALQCAYMSNVPDTAKYRATIGPEVNFCERIACNLYGKQR
ncbi:MAG: acyl carrier protein [Alphaproteobacteria bacterium]|nr:acyl carrier protein [Alphaproteobacteria bacterium]